MPQQFRTELFRRSLLAWYAAAKRDLPWRASRDPYRIWISEVMLQQTRVAAVLPFYERFVARFPRVEDLAAAEEQDVLRYWAGLGYYSRARNLHNAAKQIVAAGGFPSTHADIRRLSGVGEYTAAAVASIAFNLPYPVLDGNVARVLARITAERGDIRSAVVRERLRGAAATVLDHNRPGDSNQALMELGATICLPKDPECGRCPVARFCEARALSRQRELPVVRARPAFTAAEMTLLIVIRTDDILLRRRSQESARLAGFWELPQAETVPSAEIVQEIGSFRHTIVSTKYVCRVATGSLGSRNAPAEFVWRRIAELGAIPLTTTARKALACYQASAGSRA